MTFFTPFIQAGRADQQLFKDAVENAKNPKAAAAVYSVLSDQDKKAVDVWYKNTAKESLGQLPSGVGGGFDWSTEAPKAKTAGDKLVYIGKKLVPAALQAVGNDQAAIHQFKKDVAKA